MPNDPWKNASDGTLTSETSDLRLMVEKLHQGTRFLVFRKTPLSDGTSILVASGIERTPRDAMKKAIASSALFRLGDALAGQAGRD